MSITRWDPFRDVVSLRDAMSHLLEDSVVRSRTPAGWSGWRSMPLDLTENEDTYTVRAELPGVKPEQVDVSIDDNILRVSAETRHEDERSDEQWLIRERQFGRTERAVTLPRRINRDDVTAEFKDGVLVITLPKTEDSKPHSIKVHSGQESGSEEIEVEGSRS